MVGVWNFLSKTYSENKMWSNILGMGVLGGLAYASRTLFGDDKSLSGAINFAMQTSVIQTVIEIAKYPTQNTWVKKFAETLSIKKVNKLPFNWRALTLSTLVTGTLATKYYLSKENAIDEKLLSETFFYGQQEYLYYTLSKLLPLSLEKTAIVDFFSNLKFFFTPPSKYKLEEYEKRIIENKQVSPKNYLDLSKRLGYYSLAFNNYILNYFIKPNFDSKKETKTMRKYTLGLLNNVKPIDAFLTAPLVLIDNQKELKNYLYENAFLNYKSCNLEELVSLAIHAQSNGNKESLILLNAIADLVYSSDDFKREKFGPGTVGVSVIKKKDSVHPISLLVLEKEDSKNRVAMQEEFLLSSSMELGLRDVPRKSSPIVFNYNSIDEKDYFNLVLFHQQTIHSILPSLNEEQQKVLFVELLNFNKLKAKIYLEQNEVKLEKIDLDKKLLTDPLSDSKEYVGLTKENNQRLEELDMIHFGPLTDSHTQNYLGPKVLFDKEGRIVSLTTIDHSNKGIGPKIFEHINTYDFNFDKINFKRMESMRPIIIKNYQEDTGSNYQKTIEIYLSGLIARRDAFTKAWIKEGRQEDFWRVCPLLEYTTRVLLTYKNEVSRQNRSYFSNQALLSMKLKNIVLNSK